MLLERALNRSTDTIMQGRVSRKSLATIIIFLHEQGESVHTMSMLTRVIVENFKNIIVKKGLVKEVESVLDATNILSSFGINNLNPQNRSIKKYIDQLEQEDILLESMTKNLTQEELLRKAADNKVKAALQEIGIHPEGE